MLNPVAILVLHRAASFVEPVELALVCAYRSAGPVDDVVVVEPVTTHTQRATIHDSSLHAKTRCLAKPDTGPRTGTQ